MDPIFIIGGVILWLLAIVFTVCLFHGAEKLRREQDAQAVVSFERPAGGYIEVVASPQVVGAS